MRIIGTTVGLGLLVAIVAASTLTAGLINRSLEGSFIVLTIAGWAVLAVTVTLLHALPRRCLPTVVMAGSVAIGLAATLAPPTTSTDAARYAWDGIVQNSGQSPYAQVPADEALANLRPSWLFSTPNATSAGPACGETRLMVFSGQPSGTPTCTAINRAVVPTIYPPVAQGYFAAVRLLVSPDARYWPFQWAGLALSLALTGVLLRLLIRGGRNPAAAALWGWSPFVASEAITNSHLDTLGALLMVAASAAAINRRGLLAGVLIGLAAGAKLIPALASPPLLGNRPWRMISAAVITFALTYVPYVAASGWSVIGYLPGYLAEEGYDSGGRFALLNVVLPAQWVSPAALMLIAGAVLASWRYADPQQPWHAQTILVGSTLLIVSPSYPWYGLLLVPFVVLSGRWEWLAVPAALTVLLINPSPLIQRLALLVAAVATAAATAQRARAAGKPNALAGPATGVGTGVGSADAWSRA